MNLNMGKYFLMWEWLSTAQVSQKASWVSIFVDIQKLPGHGLGQLALDGPAWAGVNQMISRGSFHPQPFQESVICLFSPLHLSNFPRVKCIIFSQMQNFLLNEITFYRFSFQQDQLDYSNSIFYSNCDVSILKFFSSEAQLIELVICTVLGLTA